MIFNVPQFIDIEDKIVGPLTAKQLGWLGVGGVCLLVAWSLLDFEAFILSAVLIGIIFGGLAFYRPNGQPLISMFGSMSFFFLRPKMYVWKRMPQNKNHAKPKKIINDNADLHRHKEITLQEIESVSQLLEIKKK